MALKRELLFTPFPPSPSVASPFPRYYSVSLYPFCADTEAVDHSLLSRVPSPPLFSESFSFLSSRKLAPEVVNAEERSYPPFSLCPLSVYPFIPRSSRCSPFNLVQAPRLVAHLSSPFHVLPRFRRRAGMALWNRLCSGPSRVSKARDFFPLAEYPRSYGQQFLRVLFLFPLTDLP